MLVPDFYTRGKYEIKYFFETRFYGGAKTMKTLSVTLIAVIFMTFFIVTWLQAEDSSKLDKAVIKESQNQKQDMTKVVSKPYEIEENDLIFYHGVPGGDRVEDSYRFLELNKTRFHLDNPRQELRLRGVNGPAEYADIKTTTVKFDQVVNGIKVASEGFTIQFESSGAYHFCQGQIDTSARNVNTNPAISLDRAKKIAFSDSLNQNTKAEAKDAELIIARFNSDFYLVWAFGVINNRGGAWKYLIDAQTGKILIAKSDVIY
jgi:Zn-dependent metalloprotease